MFKQIESQDYYQDTRAGFTILVGKKKVGRGVSVDLEKVVETLRRIEAEVREIRQDLEVELRYKRARELIDKA